MVHRNYQLCASQLIPSWLFCKLCAQEAAHCVTWVFESREPRALMGNAAIFPNQTTRLGSIISQWWLCEREHECVWGEWACESMVWGRLCGKKWKEKNTSKDRDQESVYLKLNLCTESCMYVILWVRFFYSCKCARQKELWCVPSTDDNKATLNY